MPLETLRAEDAPEELAPAGQWSADFADDSCSLTRRFGDSSRSITLRLRQFAPQPGFEVTLASDTLNLRLNKPTYAFAGGDAQEMSFYQTFRIDGGARGVIFDGGLKKTETGSTIPAPAPATLNPSMKTVDSLTIENVFEGDFKLRAGSLEQPLEVLATCLDDLLTTWGLDAAAHHSLTKPVTEASPDNVWPGWLENGARIITRWPSDRIDFVLLVSETGRIDECRVVGGSDDRDLADRICEAMPADWQFDPALDASGKPIRSYYRSVITRMRRVEYSSF